jgi:hypothetical protein
VKARLCDVRLLFHVFHAKPVNVAALQRLDLRIAAEREHWFICSAKRRTTWV